MIVGMKFIVVTNNPSLKDSKEYPVYFVDGQLLDVMLSVRDHIHMGHRLLSHPLSGSVKPGDTPYKSILISQSKGSLDNESVSLIEEAIGVCRKLGPEKESRKRLYSEDYQVVDKSLIDSAIESAMQV